MTKKYEIVGLDCAVCAQKAEDAINKIDGVSAKITFVTEKFTFTAEDGAFDAKLAEAKKILKRAEPGARIVDL